MAWCNDNNPISDIKSSNHILITPSPSTTPSSFTSKDGVILGSKMDKLRTLVCPCCGHHIPIHGHHQQGSGIEELPGMPAGVKFDPTDVEILGHLEAKSKSDLGKLHPLLDEFIPTIEGENGICYTHPDKLPGLSKDGVMRHFFHRPSKAYTTGTRKRRKVNTSDEDGGETRWHKTGKTRPIVVDGSVKGFKKILVLYTNYGRQRKPEKTNWVMHQYHLGLDEEERDGEFVLSKVFYQTQPRQCGGPLNVTKDNQIDNNVDHSQPHHYAAMKGSINHYQSSLISYSHGDHVVGEPNRDNTSQLLPNLMVHGDGTSMFQLFGAKK